MINQLINPAHPSLRITTRCIVAFVFLIILSEQFYAQTKPTDGSTPPALTAGAPVGAYALDGFDNINLYNGSLNFSLPLLHIGGRGGASHTIMLTLERHWMVEHYVDDQQNWYNWPIPEREEEIKPGYGPGVMAIRTGGTIPRACPTPFGNVQYDQLYRYTQTLTRLSFTAPDGTETEFRDLPTGGQARGGVCPSYTGATVYGYDRGRVFVSADGSATTFISDTDIYDPTSTTTPTEDHDISGVMLLRDGTRYGIGNGLVSWIQDRNGNQISFTYDINSRLTSITDSLNRQVTIAYDVAVGGQYGTCDTITYKGFGGATRTIYVSKTNLGSALRAGYSLTGYNYLFPYLNGSATNFDPTVVSKVWLPDGVRNYQFQYNNYGEIARVTLPTGGAFEYDFAGGTTNSGTGGVIFLGNTNPQIYRRVTQRRVYPDGVTLASRMNYSIPETENVSTCCSVSTLGYVVTEERDGSGTQGTLLASSMHYFLGTGAANSLNVTIQTPLTLTSWQEGKESKAESYNVVNGVTTSVLRRSENTWQAGPSFTNNGRVTETDTTLEPSGVNLISKQTFAYDQYNNRTDVYDYDFGTGVAGALIRHTHTDFLTTNSVNGAAYDTLNPSATAPDLSATIHLRGLPVQTSIYDPNGVEQARTTYEYDNYATTTPHAALMARAGISGLDSAHAATSYQTRGNMTATTRYLLTNGSVTGSISAYAQYDVAGNVVQAIDPRTYATTFDFSDRFGAPNGEARSNTAPTQLNGQTSYALATSITNALNQTAYVQFDYYLGQPVDSEDANGVLFSGYYNDVLDRPTQAINAVGTAAQNQTTFSYDDANRIVTTTSDQSSYGDNVLKAQVLYDQMGRNIESRQYETATNYIATQQHYDALGRVYQVSNPFRPWQNESSIWMTTQFDALGRIITATTADGAQVTTSYNGNQVTVTDQAGKMRRSVSDALGRLTTVYEDPNGLNYQTSYAYDVLGNLRTVTQGAQTRSFGYDSLSRPTSATNPESGTVSYSYDANGNVLTKTDARSITTTLTYDALNRNITVDYSNTTVNPDINRYFDNPTTGAYGKGRPWYENYQKDDGHIEQAYTDFYDALGRPYIRRQNFYANSVWTSYQMSRTFDKAGHVSSETYPSGHTVNYNYDTAGRLGDAGTNLAFTGNLGDNITRTYAQSISYNSRSQMQEEQYGTTTPLYHKLHYNSRGQLYDIRLSTVPWATDPLNWNRGCLAAYYDSGYHWGGGGGQDSGPDNNGNILRMQNWVPANDQMSSYQLFDDFYSYDSLNRLTQVQMNPSGFAQMQQAYTYDRWGNRTINTGATWGTGINNTTFNVNTTKNQLTSVGAGTMTYDAAGNLITNTYNPPISGAANFFYDAENRLTEVQNGLSQTLDKYNYDADGQRVRRTVSGVETWQVYGLDGELLAEYAATAAAVVPQKEYGYRGGALLITTEGTTTTTANDSVWIEDSLPTGAQVSVGGANEAWNWVTTNPSPASGSVSDQTPITAGIHQQYFQSATQTLTVNAGENLVAYVYLDPSNMPSELMLQFFDGSWEHRAYWGANNIAWGTDGTAARRLLGSLPAGGQWVRLEVPAAAVGLEGHTLNGFALTLYDGRASVDRVGKAVVGNPQWLVPDQLGTPRIIADKTGSLSGIKRHDYLPFGEELFAGTGGRATTQGFPANQAAESIRQQFTGYERDSDTGLDYTHARYYANSQGRFTSPDPFAASAKLTDPQTLNRYTYVHNNPLVFTDPTGQAGMHAPAIGSSGMWIDPFISSALNWNKDDDEAWYDQMVAAAFSGIDESASLDVSVAPDTTAKGDAVDADPQGKAADDQSPAFPTVAPPIDGSMEGSPVYAQQRAILGKDLSDNAISSLRSEMANMMWNNGGTCGYFLNAVINRLVSGHSDSFMSYFDQVIKPGVLGDASGQLLADPRNLGETYYFSLEHRLSIGLELSKIEATGRYSLDYVLGHEITHGAMSLAGAVGFNHFQMANAAIKVGVQLGIVPEGMEAIRSNNEYNSELFQRALFYACTQK